MRGKSKTVIAICMSMCLAVGAPLSCYRIESKAVVAEAIALSAATLALTYLAASGINYIFNGMESGDAKSYLNGKITEYTSEVQEPPPLTNFKINKLGAIVIGASLAEWLSGFANWIVGTGTNDAIGDNEVKEVYSTSDSNLLTLNYTYSYGAGVTSEQLGSDLYSKMRDTSGEYKTSDMSLGDTVIYTEDLYTSVVRENNGYNFIYVYLNGNSIAKYQITGPNDTITKTFALAVNSVDNALVVLRRYGNASGVAVQRIARNFIYENVDATSVSVKTGVKDIPQVVTDTDYDVGIEIKQPAGVATVGVGADAVPYPLTDAQVWENIMALVAANTAQAVAYAPTKERTEEFPAVVDINTPAYDIPLTDEEIKDITAVGDLASALDLIQDAIDWFIDIFNWDVIKTKFPFSVPYDVWLLFSTFTSADYDILGGTLPSAPVENAGIRKAANNAPVYEMQVPFMYDTNHNLVTGTVTLDFSAIDPIRPLIRAGCGILFTAVLLLFIV